MLGIAGECVLYGPVDCGLRRVDRLFVLFIAGQKLSWFSDSVVGRSSAHRPFRLYANKGFIWVWSKTLGNREVILMLRDRHIPFAPCGQTDEPITNVIGPIAWPGSICRISTQSNDYYYYLGLLQVGTLVNSEHSTLTFGKQKCIYENCGYSLIFECAAQMNGLFLNVSCPLVVFVFGLLDARNERPTSSALKHVDVQMRFTWFVCERARAANSRDTTPSDGSAASWRTKTKVTVRRLHARDACDGSVFGGKRGDGRQHAPLAHSRELNSLTITENERKKWTRRSLNLFLNADAETALVCVCVLWSYTIPFLKPK